MDRRLQNWEGYMARGGPVRYVCSECGFGSAAWTGKCPACGAWGTLEKEAAPSRPEGGAPAAAEALSVLSAVSPERISSGCAEFDRVLGGGWVPGGVALLGGQPGVGKSTLLLQACGRMSGRGLKVLYVSGEESSSQVAMRARRLGSLSESLHLLCGSDLSGALQALEDHDFLVLDSVQAMRAEGEGGWPGSPAQVRAVAQRCLDAAKGRSIPAVLVGHITKEGRIAGPMLLEHMVDTVLSFSGEEYSSFRMLRAVKNRFGSTDELGVFEMTEEGLVPVKDLSGLYWNKAAESVPGVAMTVVMEGSMPLVAEIQSLASATAFPYPRRTARGLDVNKVHLFSAVIEKRCGTGCGLFDIYVNVAGGLNLREPGADLALCASLASSVRDVSLPADHIFLGEVGLAGEIRPVVRIAQRLREAARLGFRKAVVSSREETGKNPPLELLKMSTLQEALKAVMA